MELRNKKTGQLGNFIINKDHFECVDLDYVPEYRNLAELNAEWEDNKNRPYVIDMWEDNCICDAKFGVELEGIERAKECGLYFETKEEAEKAIEKLKAWKRLEEAGFEFKKWKHKPLFSYHYGTVKQNDGYKIYIEAGSNKLADYMQDLDLLFGGEE